MKQFTGSLSTFLGNKRGSYDAPLAFVDCFTFTLKTGFVVRSNNSDSDIIYLGNAFPAAAPRVQGLKFKGSVGLGVDRQQITLLARPTDLLNGAPMLGAIAQGAFEGAAFSRTRVFYDMLGGTQQGGVVLFSGRVATVDNAGRTKAQITVASGVVILDYNMPRNLYSSGCIHSLYDAGCGVNRFTFQAPGVVAPGSTSTVILTSAAIAGHIGGEVVFTTGQNAGIIATVRAVSVGVSLTLLYPTPSVPTTGDAFVAYDGCDHTRGTCQFRFNNLANFRGFPFIPPPQIAY